MVVVGHTDNRPERALASHRAWERAPRRTACDLLGEGVSVLRNFQREEFDFADPKAAFKWPFIIHQKSHSASFRVWQRQELLLPSVRSCRANSRPVFSVVAELDVVRRTAKVRVPVDDHAAELARLAKIDGQYRFRFMWIRLPLGVPIAVDGEFGVGTRGRRRRCGGWRAGVRFRLAQGAEGEIIEPDGAAAAFGRGNDDLDRTRLTQRLAGGPPGELKMTAARGEPRPLAGKLERAAIDPPDVVA